MAIIRLDDGMKIERDLDRGRGYWIQVIGGVVGLNGTEIARRRWRRADVGDHAFNRGRFEAEVLLIDLS